MSIIDFKQLPSIRERHTKQKIVFCSGSFDLAHAGHVLFFEDCKKHGDILVVMVGNDVNLRKYKGEDRPILNEHLRLKMISALNPVDYAFLDLDAQDKDILDILPRVFENLQPDFYVINQDAFDIQKRHEFAQDYNVKIMLLERSCPLEFNNISTTQIIEKIKESASKPALSK